MDEELERHGLKDTDILQLFCLQGNLEPVKGCDGPSLDGSPSDLPKLLNDRWTHVVGAYVRQRDNSNHLLVNNAYVYLKEDPTSRWPLLLARSRRKSIPNWSCCINLDDARTTLHDPAPAAISHEQNKEADDICLLPRNCYEEHPEMNDLYTSGFPTTDDPTDNGPTAHGLTLDAPSRVPLSCTHCKTPAFQTLRSFIQHLRQCSATSELARAKTLEIPTGTCVYSCGYSLNNYTEHEKRPHFACPCGEIVTKTKLCNDALPKKQINPAEYFMRPPTESPWPTAPTAHDLLVTAFSKLQPPLVESLARLDNTALASKIRVALEKCQAPAVPSLGTCISIDIEVTDESAAPMPDPSNKSAYRIQGSGHTVEASSDHSNSGSFERVNLVSMPTGCKASNGRQAEHLSIGKGLNPFVGQHGSVNSSTPPSPVNMKKRNGETVSKLPKQPLINRADIGTDVHDDMVDRPITGSIYESEKTHVAPADTNPPYASEATLVPRLPRGSRAGHDDPTDTPNMLATQSVWKTPQHRDDMFIPDTGPQYQLVMERVVPDTAASVALAMNGDIPGLLDLFNRGLASPRDVSFSRRFTLMRWVLYGGMHHFEVIKFLINKGAHVDECSYQHVFDFAFRLKCNNTELQELTCVRNSLNRDWIGEQRFPQIHLILFRLYRKPLADELEDKPDAILETDTQGRTALDWATARGQLDEMKLLIEHGSSPNTMDNEGRTTLLHAVDSHIVEAVRIVLEAGANPNPTIPKGYFRSSPLVSASYGGLAKIIKLLLKFGANINACNPEGRTALHSTAFTNNVECTTILLSSGADLECELSNGYTPLMTAIAENSYAVLELFVKHHIGSMKGSQLLPIIAEHADVETMSILASPLPPKLSLDLSGCSFAAGRKTLEQRSDYNQRLSSEFDKLFSIPNAVVSPAADSGF